MTLVNASNFNTAGSTNQNNNSDKKVKISNNAALYKKAPLGITPQS